jgi:hypothetical protein
MFSIITIFVSDSRGSCALSHCLHVVRTCGARRRRVVRVSGSCVIRVLSYVVRACCFACCSRVVHSLCRVCPRPFVRVACAVSTHIYIASLMIAHAN